MDEAKEKLPLKKGTSYLVLSQFAYSLVIVTVLMGILGRWIGVALLGGRPWDIILLILFGLLGFGGEVYRMVITYRNLTAREEAESRKKGEDNDS